MSEPSSSRRLTAVLSKDVEDATVEEAGLESFPASDSPSWWAGVDRSDRYKTEEPQPDAIREGARDRTPRDPKEAAMSTGKLGVPAAHLTDRDLERQLHTMWLTREETVLHGGGHALAAHTHRMLELEFEYIARFAAQTAPNPARTRRGARARDGQQRGRRSSP